MTPKQEYEKSLQDMFGPEIPRMHKVSVEGRCVPGLYARDRNDIVEFCFSHNFSMIYEVPRNAAIIFASAVANALAIGAGYSCVGATTKDRPFAPSVIQISADDAETLTDPEQP